jgi:hypothetical protein
MTLTLLMKTAMKKILQKNLQVLLEAYGKELFKEIINGIDGKKNVTATAQP